MPKRKSRRSTSKVQPEWPAGQPLYQSPLPPDQPGARFDQPAVDKVVKALRALRHTKGKWAGSRFELEDWQLEHIVSPIFGWKGPDGNRIIRTAWIELPRKNGKSTISSALALVLLCADGEMGAEVYAAAGSTDQALIVFGAAREMARATPALSGKLRLMKKVITAPTTGGVFRVLSRMADTAHGLNVSGAVIDEVHVHKSRDLIDAIETGTGSREQPLVIFITTADQGEMGTIYGEKHEYAVNLANRTITDPTFYGAVWAADESDDPFDERTWRKANPGLGVTVNTDYLVKEAQRARVSPSYYPTFQRLSLNLRVRSEARFLHLADWDRTAGLVSAEKLLGRTCYAGLDLASTTDIAAFVLLFPDPDGRSYDVLWRFWVPQENIHERGRRDKVDYASWVAQGLITATPGNVIDYSAIRSEIISLGLQYNIRDIAYDRWGATQLSQDLDNEGFTIVPMGQGFASMSPPTKELERLVLERKIRHGGNSVARWMCGNAVVRTDPAENLKLDKAKSTGRIDGLVALVMALDRAIRNPSSVYEQAGGMAL
jgi:phage terminase large subunit-like protein